MRVPANSTIGYTSLLLEHSLPESSENLSESQRKQLAEYILTIQSNASYMLELLEATVKYRQFRQAQQQPDADDSAE